MSEQDNSGVVIFHGRMVGQIVCPRYFNSNNLLKAANVELQVPFQLDGHSKLVLRMKRLVHERCQFFIYPRKVPVAWY